jgi:capsular exopolysaccharide synthesis family protein
MRAADVMRQGLTLLKYGRTMLLLFAFGLTLGLTYYTYCSSVYMTKSLGRYESVELPMRSNDSVGDIAKSLTSRHFTELTARRLGLTGALGDFHYIRDRFIKKVYVHQVDGETFVMEVYAFSPELAAIWPEALIDEYKERKRINRTRGRARAVDAYSKEMKHLLSRMEEDRSRSRSFEEENRITEMFIEQFQLADVPRQIITRKARQGEMERLRTMLDTGNLNTQEQLALLTRNEEQTRPTNVGDIVVGSNNSLVPISGTPKNATGQSVVVMPSMVNELEPWQVLEENRRKVAEQYKTASLVYLPGNVKMKGLQSQLDTLDQQLNEELRVARNRFDLAYQQLTTEIASLEDKLPEYRQISRQYEGYLQKYQLQSSFSLAWKESYQRMAQALTLMDYTADDKLSQIEFLGYSFKTETPVSPNRKQMMFMAFALGAVLAVAVPFGLNYIDDTLSKLDEVEEDLDMTGLGIIPLHNVQELENLSRSPLMDASVPNRLMENFRVIRSAIALNKEMTLPSQVIMVTSARPQEGKTMLAANLAWSFASIHEKTLILDVDLRRGRQHALLGVKNDIGLTSVFSRKVKWQDAIQQTNVPGLHVLTRGPIIPGSTERLCSDEFFDLMEELRKHYGRIILDSPPVLGLSETCSLQRVVDGVLLVVMAEKTPRREVQMAHEQLRKTGGKFYGFVLNRLDLERAANYYNYYYYSSYYYSSFEDGDTPALPGEAPSSSSRKA